MRAAGFDAFLIGETLDARIRSRRGIAAAAGSVVVTARERVTSGTRQDLRRDKLVGRALAVDLGADALGFNFYPPSPRSVSPAAAWEIIRRLPPMVSTVGVFVNWPAEVVAALARALRLISVQLHGDEPPERGAANWRARFA